MKKSRGSLLANLAFLVFCFPFSDGKVDPSSSYWWRRFPTKLKTSTRKPNTPHNTVQQIEQRLTTGRAKPGPRWVHQTLYWITAVDAVDCVLRNEYPRTTSTSKVVLPKLIYFARLRPRLLYSVGALLRALQLCTPFQRVIDPRIGVGAGINICAIIAGSRWVKPLVLGWTTTRWIWSWLGASQLERAFVPISLSIHEWEKRHRRQKQKNEEEED